MNGKNDIWKDEQLRQLADVLASISDPNEIRAFLRDVMTQREIIEVGARLQAAKMLSKGEKYADIIATTKLSSRTVARISDWMQNGTGGYKNVFEHHSHVLPARAEEFVNKSKRMPARRWRFDFLTVNLVNFWRYL